MHPAYSVIFFTTSSGAGYGLLALLGLGAAFGMVPAEASLGLVGLGLATALISAGLLSSTAHLGRPERAWRAFSQWRTSWLSREGVFAVATFIPVALLGFGWVFLSRTDGLFAAMGILSAIGAAVTVVCTAMIYASLKPVAQWHSRYTLTAYMIFSLMTGSLIFCALLYSFGAGSPKLIFLAVACCVAGWGWKVATWRHNDRLVPASTANTATGLAGGTVSSVEWPHTGENYLLKEMGFRVARKHARRLRMIATVLAFVLPIMLLIAAVPASGILAAAILSAAAIIQLAGMLVERWLFFAEARHTVSLYY
jgi:sulfite dehydrogenase (quinone) subunit SoeC